MWILVGRLDHAVSTHRCVCVCVYVRDSRNHIKTLRINWMSPATPYSRLKIQLYMDDWTCVTYILNWCNAPFHLSVWQHAEIFVSRHRPHQHILESSHPTVRSHDTALWHLLICHWWQGNLYSEAAHFFQLHNLKHHLPQPHRQLLEAHLSVGQSWSYLWSCSLHCRCSDSVSFSTVNVMLPIPLHSVAAWLAL